MAEESTGFSWMAMIRNIGLALVMFTGGGIGSYASMQEMQKEEAIFRYQIQETLKNIDKRLEALEDKP